MAGLVQKKCLPCEGIGQAFTKKEAERYLVEVSGWTLDQAGKTMSCSLVLKNFMATIDLINRIAQVAEAENHHPDLHVTGYRNLKIDLSTHALGGLTENDFILAAKINVLPKELRKK